MREPNLQNQFFTRPGHILAAGLLLSLIGLQLAAPVQAESLFRASTNYQEKAPIGSHSLFTPPISRDVGDLVTILVDEKSKTGNESELKITRNQQLAGNSAGGINYMLRFFGSKLPFVNGYKVANALSVPSVSTDTNNNFDSKANTSRTRTVQDSIACQVVQVLPNGDLVVQGQKTVQMNKEREDLMVTGIVKPFYLDRYNQISSKMVGNFQMIQGGKGVISRQQNDGVINKVYQFFN